MNLMKVYQIKKKLDENLVKKLFLSEKIYRFFHHTVYSSIERLD